MLLKDFWFPFSDTHVVRAVNVPSQSCEKLCVDHTDCCRWGVREVRKYTGAQHANVGLAEFGWEVHGGPDWGRLVDGAAIPDQRSPQWCTGGLVNDYCSEDGAAGRAAGVAAVKKLTIFVDITPKRLRITHGSAVVSPDDFSETEIDNNPTVATLPAARVPGQDGSAFYLLVTADRDGWKFWDKDGTLRGDSPEAQIVTQLRQDPTDTKVGPPTIPNIPNVVWVKSFSCGLFKKDDARAARLRALTLVSGTLARCGGDGGDDKKGDDKKGGDKKGGKGGKGHESIVDADEAFKEAVAQFTGRGGMWSVDASAGSPGISFASIVCAVFSSVALVFLVLFAAKKNSQLEVVVADE